MVRKSHNGTTNFIFCHKTLLMLQIKVMCACMYLNDQMKPCCRKRCSRFNCFLLDDPSLFCCSSSDCADRLAPFKWMREQWFLMEGWTWPRTDLSLVTTHTIIQLTQCDLHDNQVNQVSNCRIKADLPVYRSASCPRRRHPEVSPLIQAGGRQRDAEVERITENSIFPCFTSWFTWGRLKVSPTHNKSCGCFLSGGQTLFISTFTCPWKQEVSQ